MSVQSIIHINRIESHLNPFLQLHYVELLVPSVFYTLLQFKGHNYKGYSIVEPF